MTFLHLKKSFLNFVQCRNCTLSIDRSNDDVGVGKLAFLSTVESLYLFARKFKCCEEDVSSLLKIVARWN